MHTSGKITGLDSGLDINDVVPDQSQLCDFKSQCSDESDEALCPTFCSFDSDACGWEDQGKDGLDWILASSESSEAGTDIHGPHNRSGSFLFLHPDKDISDFSHKTAVVVSPQYQNSAASCILKSWLYLSGELGNTLDIMISINGNNVTLDKIDIERVEDGVWTVFETEIGRRQPQFEVILSFSTKVKQFTQDCSRSCLSKNPPLFTMPAWPLMTWSCLTAQLVTPRLTVMTRPNGSTVSSAKSAYLATKSVISRTTAGTALTRTRPGVPRPATSSTAWRRAVWSSVRCSPTTPALTSSGRSGLGMERRVAPCLTTPPTLGPATISMFQSECPARATRPACSVFLSLTTGPAAPRSSIISMADMLATSQSGPPIKTAVLWERRLVGNIRVVQSYSAVSSYLSLVRNLDGLDVWRPLVLDTIISAQHPFQIVVQAFIQTESLAGDLALDDWTFPPGCSFYSGVWSSSTR